MTSRLLTSFFASVTLLTFAFPAHFALAQSEDGETEVSEEAQQEARELFLRGDRLYAEGQYEEAVAAFLEAYQLSGRPELLFNLANAYERLGRLEEALDALLQYAPHTPSYDEATIERRIQNIQDRIHQEESNARESGSGTGSQNGATSEVDEGADLTGPIALLAAGGVAAAAGLVFAMLSSSEGSDADDLCATNGLCPSTAQDAIDNEESFALAADISGGLGAALLAGGIVWTLIALDDEPESESPAQLVPQLGPTHAGVQGRLRF